MLNVERVESRLWYISDVVVVTSNEDDTKILAYPTVDDPTVDDWEKVKKVIKKIGMTPISNRFILDGKECIEVKEN